MEGNKNQGIFINGKKQIIEMLQYMNEEERKKLLGNIRQRNAPMARELSEQSLSFQSLEKFDDYVLQRIFQHVNTSIIGLALSLTTSSFQRRVLSIIDRDSAEEAYAIMSQNLAGKRETCVKAQNKILHLTINLSKRGIVSF